MISASESNNKRKCFFSFFTHKKKILQNLNDTANNITITRILFNCYNLFLKKKMWIKNLLKICFGWDSSGSSFSAVAVLFNWLTNSTSGYGCISNPVSILHIRCYRYVLNRLHTMHSKYKIIYEMKEKEREKIQCLIIHWVNSKQCKKGMVRRRIKRGRRKSGEEGKQS